MHTAAPNPTWSHYATNKLRLTIMLKNMENTLKNLKNSICVHYSVSDAEMIERMEDGVGNVGQIKCFICSVNQPNPGAYLNHLDSEHLTQTVESIQNLIRELSTAGNPDFEDWTCMGCFTTDLLPGKKSEVSDLQAAVLNLENHLKQCTQAVDREKDSLERMQEKDDKTQSLGSLLNNNLWRVCPLCGDSKKSRDEMVSHLLYHPQLKDVLDKSILDKTAFTCEDGCMPVWHGRSHFMLHKFRNCEKGAKRRLDHILSTLTKIDVMGDGQSDDGLSDISEDEVMEELVLEGDAERGGHSTVDAKEEESPSSGEPKPDLPLNLNVSQSFSDASSQTLRTSGKEEIMDEDIPLDAATDAQPAVIKDQAKDALLAGAAALRDALLQAGPNLPIKDLKAILDASNVPAPYSNILDAVSQFQADIAGASSAVTRNAKISKRSLIKNAMHQSYQTSEDIVKCGDIPTSVLDTTDQGSQTAKQTCKTTDSGCQTETEENCNEFNTSGDGVKCEDIQAPVLDTTDQASQTADKNCQTENRGCQTETEENCNELRTAHGTTPELVDGSSQTNVEIAASQSPAEKSQVEKTPEKVRTMEDDAEGVNATAFDNTTEEESSDNGKRSQNRHKGLVGEASIRCSQCHGIFETSSKYKSKIKHFCKFLGGKLKQCPEVEVGAKSGAKRITMTCTLCRLNKQFLAQWIFFDSI